MKLNLGAGEQVIEGFVSVDLYDPVADIKADICELPFDDNSVDEIVAYQVIEHIPYQKSKDMLLEMYRVLKPGKTATVETPDIDIICKRILTNGIDYECVVSLVGEYYRPWDKERFDDWENHIGAIHRNPWNFRRLKDLGEDVGFTVKRIQPSMIKAEENMCVCLKK